MSNTINQIEDAEYRRGYAAGYQAGRRSKIGPEEMSTTFTINGQPPKTKADATLESLDNHLAEIIELMRRWATRQGLY